LRQWKTKIFLQGGLDKALSDLPVKQQERSKDYSGPLNSPANHLTALDLIGSGIARVSAAMPDRAAE
jgi:hypothetical protein